MKAGAILVIMLFALTIVLAVSFKNFLGLPPALGMMLGLALLQITSYGLKREGQKRNDMDMQLDRMAQIQRVEWDTLLFFFGIIFAVGGLGVLGYLRMASDFLYSGLGATSANIIIGRFPPSLIIFR
jgi:Na+/H+ antiporter NhaD/arsenite permease-like protein